MAAHDKADLFKALERDEIVPYFQPLVELRTGKLTGFEVLSRWKHPSLGMIPPDKFIPLAEESGAIGLLTQKLLRKAFAAASAIPSPLSLSVNISPLQFRDIGLPMQVEEAAVTGGFGLHRLILEVTESALADNVHQARAISMGLKELGVRLALDDFGTGYSSLRHLQALPFDEIKVDASFVRSMDYTRESRKIAAAVIGLGHSLGLTTLAEGVETKAQAEMLLWLGCEYGQGWLFGRPVPAEDLPGIVSKESLSPADDSPSGSVGETMMTRLEALPTQRLAQLQAIYDGAPVGLCFLDTNSRYMSINKRLAAMNGAPIADHIGRRVVDLHPEMYKIVEPFIRRALKGESLSGIEVTSPKPGPDGRLRTLLLSYEPARDEADEVIGVSVGVVDISARTLAEEALKESEDHYRHAVELNPQIPWTADPDALVVDISPRWEEMTGLTSEQTGNNGWLRVVHPDDVAPTAAIVGRCMNAGEPIDVEFRVRCRDGAWRWMRSRGLPLRDASEKIIRWYGSVEDIDDRKKMEQALIDSEALFKAVFDAAPVGIVIAEAPSGRILMHNPRTEAILGRPLNAAQSVDEYRRYGARHTDGRPFEPEDYPLARAITTGEPTGAIEFLFRQDDESEIWISANASPIRNSEGVVTGGVVAILDIDDAKREKQAMLDRISELEKLVDQLKKQPAPVC